MTETAEQFRWRVARYMFEFLVRRGAWFGVRNWNSLDQEIRNHFHDMAAMIEDVELRDDFGL